MSGNLLRGPQHARKSQSSLQENNPGESTRKYIILKIREFKVVSIFLIIKDYLNCWYFCTKLKKSKITELQDLL